jgi:hypothetical protein
MVSMSPETWVQLPSSVGLGVTHESALLSSSLRACQIAKRRSMLLGIFSEIYSNALGITYA